MTFYQLLSVALALGLPWLLGSLWLRWLPRGPGATLVQLSYGYLLGNIATGLVIRAVDGLGLALNFALLATIVFGLALLGVLLPTRRYLTAATTLPVSRWRDQTGWQKWLFVLLATLIALRFASGAAELALRPLYAWDAWTTWVLRAKVWFASGELVGFIAPSEWLAAADADRHAAAAWDYPPAVSLIPLWMMLGQSEWSDAVAHLPWLVCALALCGAFYGQARLWGISPATAITFTYLLASLPMLNAHVALAGYADLWLATAYGLAVLAFLQWLRSADPRYALLALITAAVCPLLKNEGAVWLLSALPALLATAALGRAWLRHTLLGLALAGAVLLVYLWRYGLVDDRADRLDLALNAELLRVPLLGEIRIAPEASIEPFVRNLFIYDNWHLLYYLLPVLVALSAVNILTRPLLLIGSLLIAGGIAMLFLLFFFTEAHLWAEQATSINRLFLHLTPALVFYLLLLFTGLAEGRGKAPAAARRPG